MLKVVFRVDASIAIGAGHVMRCLTLAHALRGKAYCEFVVSKSGAALSFKIENAGYNIHVIDDINNDPAQHATNTLAVISPETDLIIIDHYSLDKRYETLLYNHDLNVMVIDDLADRKHHCDLLLDGNLLPDYRSRYDGLVSNNCTMLLGPQFALLREEFYAPVQTKRPKHLPNIALKTNEKQKRKRILVCFGGTDPQNVTDKTLSAISKIDATFVDVDVVIGSQHENYAQIVSKVAQFSTMTLHVDTTRMAILMQQATIMIGAGGSMHWERCVSALPGIIITLAANQVATTKYLSELGACEWLGESDSVTEETIKRSVIALLNDSSTQQCMSQIASQLVPKDGGVDAVVDAIIAKMIQIKGESLLNSRTLREEG
ncbi:UDP-2,4-diacetamido-2,4,6-trideoxy-beta-L-altropyranose hydrolase [Alteromonas sp. CI.11.F.A3]|uniref:UDP-2,4-diacetamido-2,4, 6-trideoxy-beta-L-altropyranose hydrolase n=1 Tax=Alteromonas sp. CI.11.F.A3 TaxID=3079555 RepID=UPI002942B342|nr:UDP-2,4-diacetamido-2,4,6-trideoxy-beta-L-altropyranose hydrolase [Alteromonas sp. CI.11.F.A3]WOI36630.1 UDP-2,4-diacetamido-2,4,6-trideoxy-beta-L-altropyranose hydrolase [Alteromonas sp. CI.11.F.A3]